jgi:hypothetical protein
MNASKRSPIAIGPTPEGVPVKIRSPVFRVIYLEMKEIISEKPKIISEELAF